MSDTRPKDRLYLQHILDAISRIESYLEGVERSQLHETSLLQDGVIRQLQIIGEAGKLLSPGLKDTLSSVPWREVTGMRDKLTHDYMGVDLEAVWKTAHEELGPLKAAVSEGLRPAGGESNGAQQTVGASAPFGRSGEPAAAEWVLVTQSQFRR